MKKRAKILIPVGIIAFIIVYDVIDSKTRISSDNRITDLIEQGDYIKAKKVAAKMQSYEAENRVTNAQVLDLIDQGRFDLASDIAKEDEYYISFFNGIIDHLTKLYNQQGGEKLLYAMSLVSFPDTNSDLPTLWGRSWVLSETSRQIVTRSNNNIESFCDYLKQTGDKQFIIKMLDYLKPVYVPESKHWDSKQQKYIIDKEAYIDNSEMKRIKAKYGYK